MRRFLAEFVAAQVRCFSGETISDLCQGNTGIDYINVLLQPQVVIAGFTSTERHPIFSVSQVA